MKTTTSQQGQPNSVLIPNAHRYSSGLGVIKNRTVHQIQHWGFVIAKQHSGN